VIGTVPLQGHPEGFQIDQTTGRAFVNVPDAGQLAVVDLDARRQTATWKVPRASGNFPMALDARQGVLAAVFRSPPSLVLLDTKTGPATVRLPAWGDADDVFFDAKRKRIYVSCGGDEIAVFQRDGGNYRRLLGSPPSRARTPACSYRNRIVCSSLSVLACWVPVRRSRSIGQRLRTGRGHKTAAQ
jgi:hypothetical protein